MDLNTYLFFDGQCEEAFRLYEKVLGGKLTGLMRYADVPSGPPAFKECKRIIHVSLRVGDRVLMGSDLPAPGLDPQDDWAGPARPPFQSPTARRRLQPLKFYS